MVITMNIQARLENPFRQMETIDWHPRPSKFERPDEQDYLDESRKSEALRLRLQGKRILAG